MIERTRDLAEMLGLEVEIDESGLNTGVTEELFDGEEIDAGFQQVSGKAVTQGVNGGRLLDSGFFLAKRKAR